MSKQDDLLYEQQEKRIQAQSDAFITLLTKRGILADQQIDDEKKRVAKQEKLKNSYHNTLLDYVTDCEYTFTVDSDSLTFVGGNGTADPGKEYKLTKIN